MTYPQAPWTLHGYAIQTVQPIDIDLVRSLIPSELEIVSIFPGKTLGGLYLASYGTGSTLEYNELIVVSGIARANGKIGIWVSHIYVDHPDSMAGGRSIWGLPKQMAQFQWEHGNAPFVKVSQGDQTLCHLSYGWQVPGMRQWLPAAGFGKRGQDLVWFSSSTQSLPHLLLNSKLTVPTSSPFASLGLDQPWLSFYFRKFDLTVNAPEVIKSGRTASYSNH
ncbi:acetoacetate decarboxylase family protein [Oculatella sp. LEGE 06141]|uniref:acetoacetate decarboxylase family protein n=1 Tax=Oculatella sp. LEGE 06141 TaxID=1828648 RepID=UPI0018828DAD|nr:acetoacetate decarboxylase family protein [Oculatella sp. LEGE 06141]MBE9179605.1 acetoacetate decarboxylase family protein [Oculatella sp. LEGE 06141]